ncbi:DUF397 domain-containing protein [Streptomyces sp. NPDC088923]|uniref:DUF397 domain-containing protein n=1 Tax=Streptomyces sp. NPDC088923 TaxID=3365913 RepID=UPI00382B2452
MRLTSLVGDGNPMDSLRRRKQTQARLFVLTEFIFANFFVCDCVEAAPLPDAIAIRDSKDTALTPLRYSAPQWADFCAALAADAL